MRRLKMALVLLAAIGLGGTGSALVNATPLEAAECAPFMACMDQNEWACVCGPTCIRFNQCNEGPGGDPFEIICVLPDE